MLNLTKMTSNFSLSKSSFVILLSLVMSLNTIAQGGNYYLSKLISYNNNGIVVDNMNNVYLFNTGGYKKFDKAGILSYNFISSEIGEVISMDVSATGNVILLYREVGNVIIYDKNNIEIGRFTTASLDVNDATQVCWSADGGFWLYDGAENNLKKFDANGKVKFKGKEMSFVSAESLEPTSMLESGGKIFLSDPNHGIYVFDQFGSFVKEITTIKTVKFQILNDNVIYCTDHKVFSYNITSNKRANITGFMTDIVPTQAYLNGTTLVVADYKRCAFFKN
jgi:hypothetical protein